MSSLDIDPWDWSIDAVIAHLCSHSGPLLPKYERIINKADLETAIQNNYITGECLLQLTDTQIEKCLGISAAGPQIHCRNSIQQLQRQSTKWMNHVSHNLILSQAHWTQLFDRLVPNGSVSVNITQTPYDLSLHRNMAQPSPRVVSKRVVPVLLPTQADRESPGQEAEVTDHHRALADDANSTATPMDERVSASDQTHRPGHLPSMRELINSVELPQVPEHLFSQYGSRSAHDETERIIKKDKRKMENKREPDYLVSETPASEMLKEFEAIQLSRWQATKLPLLELKAYQLWTEAKEKKKLMQDCCLQKIEKLQHRLQGLEKEILVSAPGRDLKRMAETLQPTVTDIAAWQWKLKLYRQARQPEKPMAQAIKTAKKRKLLDAEDDIDLSSDDWEDFIDNDSEDDDYDGDYEDSLEDEDEPSHDNSNPTKAFDKVQPIQTAQGNIKTSPTPFHAPTKAGTDTKDISKPAIESIAGDSSSLIPTIPLEIKANTHKEVIIAKDSSLPPYWDLGAWKKKSAACIAGLEAHSKQECILAWNIAHSLDSWRKVCPFILAENNSNAAWSKLNQHLRFMLQSKHLKDQTVGKTNKDGIDWSIQIAVWYMSWYCVKATKTEGLRRFHIASVLKSTEDNSGRDSFKRFWRVLQEIKEHWVATQTKATPNGIS